MDEGSTSEDTSRDQILSMFQDITQIDDLPLCIQLLESANWDLEVATERVFTNGPVTQSDASQSTVTVTDVRPCDLVRSADSDRNHFIESPDLASNRTMESSGADRNAGLPNSNIYSDISSDEDMHDYAAARASVPSLGIQGTSLIASQHEFSSTNGDNSDTCRVSVEYISNDGFSSKESVSFSSSTTILQVKLHFGSLYAVPLAEQEWSGWPPGASSDTPLSALGTALSLRLERMSFGEPLAASDSNFMSNHFNASVSSGGSPPHIIGDSDDDDAMQLGEVEANRRTMMEENAADDVTAQEQFMLNFRSRFGDSHPLFFLGSLKQALDSSCNLPAKDRKLLAIYIHHDRSVYANVFCEQVLCSSPVVHFLNENGYVIWAWDATLDSNMQTLFHSLSTEFGPPAVNELRKRNFRDYPIMIILARQRGVTSIMHLISGSQALDEVVAMLVSSQETFREGNQHEIQADWEREQNDRLLREQNSAFEESLQADRLKEQQRRAEEKKQKAQEDMERRKIEEKEVFNQVVKMSFADTVEAEPPADFTGEVTSVRIRTPSHENKTRKFYATSKLSSLFNYVASLGYFPHEYKIMSSFPRKEISAEDKDATTFKEANLFPSAALIIEKR